MSLVTILAIGNIKPITNRFPCNVFIASPAVTDGLNLLSKSKSLAVDDSL